MLFKVLFSNRRKWAIFRAFAFCRTRLADIAYIPMRRGFLYLVAIMDWYSRKVLAWRLSNSMDAEFCIEALKEALAKHGTPEVFNTDQGS